MGAVYVLQAVEVDAVSHCVCKVIGEGRRDHGAGMFVGLEDAAEEIFAAVFFLRGHPGFALGEGEELGAGFGGGVEVADVGGGVGAGHGKNPLGRVRTDLGLLLIGAVVVVG